jgi:hypothetical protein
MTMTITKNKTVMTTMQMIKKVMTTQKMITKNKER